MKKQVGNSVYFGSGSRSHSRSNCFSEGFVGEARRIVRDELPGALARLLDHLVGEQRYR